MEIIFRRHNDYGRLPIKGTPQSAAFDLYSCETRSLGPNTRTLVDTGLTLDECPDDVYLRIAPRSGLAVKGYDIGAGVVDSDYRGKVKILFINNSNSDYTINVGDRIAQLIPEMIRSNVKCRLKGEYNNTNEEFLRDVRGDGGFGST